MLASYTFSKSLDVGSEYFAAENNGPGPQSLNNLAGEYGPSAFDVAHNTVGALYDLPSEKGEPFLNSGIASKLTARLQTLVQQEVELGHKGPEMTRKNDEAIAFEQRGDFTSAERNYRELITIDPEIPVFRRNLGLSLCRQERWNEGLEELRRALALDPDDTESERALRSAVSLSHNQK